MTGTQGTTQLIISQQQFFVPGPLPGMNELIGALNTGSQKNANIGRVIYNNLKDDWQSTIGWSMKKYRIRPFTRAKFTFHWQEKEKRRDPDNISAGGRKLIFDAMVKGKIMPGDGWKVVLGFQDLFSISKKEPGVWVNIRLE